MHRALTVALTAAALIIVPAESSGAPMDPGAGGVSADAPAATATPEGSSELVAAIAARRVLLAGPRPQTLTFTVPGSGTAAVVVELYRSGAVAPVERWELRDVTRGEEQRLRWDGGAEDGRGEKDGRYRFRIGVDGAAPAPVAESFEYLRAYFPVRGPHVYGDGPGAGRGHQGQDILADCGTPLLAARGGTVERAGYDGGGGNYVVIDVVGSPSDMVYMHLQQPSPLKAGDDVHTGQRIGDVGTTGRSTACHLHFELWSGPGYFTGGRPIDPSRQLRLWDEQSGGNRDVTAAKRR
ncbi:M23 family metallopeptidase [Paraconexibacter algicola]|uniref:M23ase beta-sheet core domain-containing protein n=1 Tax=Paraconexibacter algicola TaxID=2133960 RepID=A0A2T4UBW2_9ACTN|nr:M23 family metallopeptidase [Paraconexibacter algicola]PTL54389.1 hypothetical protein C7Y72_21900 [Paraconexibacter algicola]